MDQVIQCLPEIFLGFDERTIRQLLSIRDKVVSKPTLGYDTNHNIDICHQDVVSRYAIF